MEESTCRKIKKSLHFEGSGETFSVEIGLENVSPKTETKIITPFLETLFENAIKDLQC